MKALILFLLIGPVTLALSDSYVEKVISAKPAEERYVSNAYDVFLMALSKKQMSKSLVDFPVSLCKESGDVFLLERAYYISPNEMRGFSLAFPKSTVRKKGGHIIGIVDLSLKEYELRQGIHCLLFRAKTAIGIHADQ